MMYVPQLPGDCMMNAMAVVNAINVLDSNPEITCLTVSVSDAPLKLDRNALEILNRYYHGEDVLFRSDYIATKLWSRDDVAACLQEKGFDGTDDEIDAVISAGYLKYLGDCTDGDWEMIYNAITLALGKKKEGVA